LAAQPPGGRLARNQQRNAIRADIHGVLAAIKATELTHYKITKWLGRYSQGTDKRATCENQQDSCPDDRERPPHRLTS
jgi:hypothetical protein